MTRPFDAQQDVVREMGELVAEPDLTADELGLVALTLERFISTGLVTQTEAARMLADRRVASPETWEASYVGAE